MVKSLVYWEFQDLWCTITVLVLLGLCCKCWILTDPLNSKLWLVNCCGFVSFKTIYMLLHPWCSPNVMHYLNIFTIYKSTVFRFICSTQNCDWSTLFTGNVLFNITFKLNGVYFNWMKMWMKWDLQHGGEIAVNYIFHLFLTQNYCMSSEYLEYSTIKVIWTFIVLFVIIGLTCITQSNKCFL